MKQHFYKIPMSRMETMLNAAAKCDRNNPERDITGFLNAWLGDHQEMLVTEDIEDEVEERRRLPGNAEAIKNGATVKEVTDAFSKPKIIIDSGETREESQARAREWHEITERKNKLDKFTANPYILQGD